MLGILQTNLDIAHVPQVAGIFGGDFQIIIDRLFGGIINYMCINVYIGFTQHKQIFS